MARAFPVEFGDASGDLDRALYTPAVVWELTGLHPRTLASYEEMGVVAAVRTRTDRRRYTGRMVRRLQVIAGLTHKQRVNVPAAIEIMKLFEVLRKNRQAAPTELADIYDAYVKSV